MRTSDFDFELPEDLIALRPAQPRDAARLLCVDAMAREDRHVTDLPALLRAGDVLVLNDTRVIAARLFAIRAPRDAEAPPARIELLLHRRLTANRYEAFARPAKRLRAADVLSVQALPPSTGEEMPPALAARVTDKGEDGLVTLAFDREGAALDAAIAALGEIPLPPYIAGRRKADARDARDYQTVFAREAGAVAAPTAGLHFTPALFDALKARGVGWETVTLHVGAGTFLPVKADDTRDHVMHAEWGRIGAGTAARLNAARGDGRRIVAVGTTSLRLLESACDAAGRLHPFAGETRIFITPGVALRAADLLFTNFHLPRSTLFMLVQAFGGIEPMRAAYAHAVAARYRFYSYGDACLIAKNPHG